MSTIWEYENLLTVKNISLNISKSMSPTCCNFYHKLLSTIDDSSICTFSYSNEKVHPKKPIITVCQSVISDIPISLHIPMAISQFLHMCGFCWIILAFEMHATKAQKQQKFFKYFLFNSNIGKTGNLYPWF